MGEETVIKKVASKTSGEVQDAIERLVKLFDNGELEMATMPAYFLRRVADEILHLRQSQDKQWGIADEASASEKDKLKAIIELLVGSMWKIARQRNHMPVDSLTPYEIAIEALKKVGRYDTLGQ